MPTDLKRKIILLITWVGLLIPTLSCAHRPRIPTNDTILVAEPELSKAYYASLTGSDHSYRIHSIEPFLLYVSVLVPDVEDLPNDLTVKVYELSKKKIDRRNWW